MNRCPKCGLLSILVLNSHCPQHPTMTPSKPITVTEYAVLAASTCHNLNGSERNLLARIIEREILRQDRKRSSKPKPIA